MHLYAFIAILAPKLVAMVTPLCPLCTGVSQVNSTIAQTLSQNQTLHGYVAYNWSYGHFCDFWPILATISLPWQRPVISNCILVISCRNAFICIYSNFSPKIGCHGNAPLSLVYGSVTHEFHDSRNPISKPNSAWICCIQLKLWLFMWFLAYFGQKFVAIATSFRPLQSEMSSLDWSTTKTPCYK